MKTRAEGQEETTMMGGGSEAGETMNRLDVIAHGTIREGKLEEFKRQAAEMIRQTKEKDTKTLRYDWFISSDGTEFEVLEAYVNSEGLVEHSMHIGEARNVLFSEFASDHRMKVYGDPSPQLVEHANALPPEHLRGIKWYSFLQGLK